MLELATELARQSSGIDGNTETNRKFVRKPSPALALIVLLDTEVLASSFWIKRNICFLQEPCEKRCNFRGLHDHGVPH